MEGMKEREKSGEEDVPDPVKKSACLTGDAKD